MAFRGLRCSSRLVLILISGLAVFFLLPHTHTSSDASSTYGFGTWRSNAGSPSSSLPSTPSSPSSAHSPATSSDASTSPQDPGLPLWMQYFNSTPIHIKEPDAPTNNAPFKGILPRFWTIKGRGDERLDGVHTVKKPNSVEKIVGLVFFGRRERVSILECYLRRNLAKNGGVLDEVIFLSRTRDLDDLQWLDETVAREPAYKRWAWDGTSWFASAYEMVRNQTLYVKIDDDIVWIDDAAIPTLVDTKINHPEYYLVGANVINQPMLSWVHWHLGAIHPFLPELQPFVNDRADGRTEWRTGNLPSWTGSDAFEFPIDWMPPTTADQLPSDAQLEALRKPATSPLSVDSKKSSTTTADHSPPKGLARHLHLDRFFRPRKPQQTAASPPEITPIGFLDKTPLRYRWLPLRGATRHGADDTPARRTEYHPFGAGWSRWPIAAQEHYSFFFNLERGDVGRYRFSRWDFDYSRMGIQFMAMMGADINAAKPIEQDDERHFSETMTRKLGRHGVVDGRALVAHYSFSHQKTGLQTTDILERYRTFAKEHICETPMRYPYP